MSCFQKTNEGNKEMIIFTIAKQFKQLSLARKSKRNKISFYICPFRKLSKTNTNLLIDAKQELFFSACMNSLCSRQSFEEKSRRGAFQLYISLINTQQSSTCLYKEKKRRQKTFHFFTLRPSLVKVFEILKAPYKRILIVSIALIKKCIKKCKHQLTPSVVGISQSV